MQPQLQQLGAAKGRSPEAAPSSCYIESWKQQRGGAPKQRPAFAVSEVGAAEGRSPEAALSFCCA